MAKTDPRRKYVKNLQTWRGRREQDYSLHFLADAFERQIVKPHQQLAQVIDAWTQLLPARLQEQCRLLSLQRGVLKVGVASAAARYELDGLLRSGLQRRLMDVVKVGALRRVQLVMQTASPADAPRAPVMKMDNDDADAC